MIDARFTKARLIQVMTLLALGLIVSICLSIAFGEQALSLGQVWAEPTSMDRAIVLSLRLPRALQGALIGAALATSGAVLQALLQNPLADPFVLGVSGGAALGGASAIAVGADRLPALVAPALAATPALLHALVDGVLGVSPVAAAAFIGAVLSTSVVFSAGRVGGRATPMGVLLAGVIFNAFASAGITCIKTLTSPQRVGALLYWLAGALGYPSYSTLLGLGALLAPALLLLAFDASALNLMSLGEESAASLGVEVPSVRRRLFFASSVCVAAAVSMSGLIGFVGLLVPHVLRLWLGPDQRLLIPACALGGASFLVIADLGVRLAFPLLGAEAPVGVLTAIIGGPLFLWLLRSRGEAIAG